MLLELPVFLANPVEKSVKSSFLNFRDTELQLSQLTSKLFFLEIMEKGRLNKYFQLTEALLRCSPQEEGRILAQNQSLINSEFVQFIHDAVTRTNEQNMETATVSREIEKQVLAIKQKLQNLLTQLTNTEINLMQWVALKQEASRLFQQGLNQSNAGYLNNTISDWREALLLYELAKDYLGVQIVLGDLGAIYASLGYYTEAVEHLQRLLVLSQQYKDYISEGQALGNLGACYIRMGRLKEAIDYLEQRLALAKSLQDTQGEGLALGNLGTVYASLGKYEQAIQYHQKSLEIADSLQDELMKERTLSNLGLVHSQLKDLTQSLVYYQRSLEIGQKINDHYGQSITLSNIGSTYSSLNNHLEAVKAYQKSLKIKREFQYTLELETLEEKLVTSIERLIDQGIEEINTNKSADAVTTLQQALSVSQENQYVASSGRALCELGLAYQILEQYPEAVDAYERSSAIFRELQNVEAEGTICLNSASTLIFQGELEKALSNLNRALEIAEQTSNTRLRSATLENLGLAYSAAKDHDKALKQYQIALEFNQEIGNRWSMTANLFNLGKIYEELENTSEAIKCYQQGLEIAKEISDKSSEISILSEIGRLYLQLENYNQAIEIYKQQLNVAQDIQKATIEIVALGNLGRSYSSLKNYSEAIQYQEKGLAVAREFNQAEVELKLLDDLAESYSFLENYSRSLEVAQQGLSLAIRLENIEHESRLLEHAARAYSSLGNYVQSISYYEKGLAVERSLNSLSGEARILTNLGTVYFTIGNLEKAFECHQQSLVLTRQNNDRNRESLILNNLGLVHRDQGDSNAALSLFNESLKIKQEVGDSLGEANALNNIANVYADLGKHDQAIRAQQQSLAIARQIKNQQRERNALGNLGDTYRKLGDLEQAIHYIQQSLEIGFNLNDRLGIATDLNNLGLAFFSANRLQEAEGKFYESIDYRESLRADLGQNDNYKVSLFDTQVNAYINLQQVLAEQGKFEAALEIAERSRTRALVELLSKRFSGSLEELDNTLPGEELATSPSFEQMQRTARRCNATIVEYSITYSNYLFAWIINSMGEKEFCPISLESLEKQNTSIADLVADSRECMNVRTVMDNSQTTVNGKSVVASKPIYKPLQQLHQLLIQPLLRFLPTDLSIPVIFVPQGVLYAVPFAALQDSEGRFLIEQHTILTVPSIHVLDLTSKSDRETDNQEKTNQKKSREVLIVGNPIMPVLPLADSSKPLSSLPAAAAEAIKIAAFLDTQALIGADAGKVNVVQKMPNARLIHLATHGILNDFKKLGTPGAIALAPSSEDDGFLTASDILQLKLNADLVVLSACETALGRITEDGVVGLSRCLMVSGIPRLVVSLWPVYDFSTAFLMTKFYKILGDVFALKPGITAYALRHAQNWLMNLSCEEAVQELSELSPHIYKAFSGRERVAQAHITRCMNAIHARAPYPFSNPIYWSAFTLVGF